MGRWFETPDAAVDPSRVRGTVGKRLTGAGTILTVKWLVPIIRVLLAGPRRSSRICSSQPGHAHTRMAWIMATARA